MYANLQNTPSRLLCNQPCLDPIVKGGDTNCKKIKWTKIAKMVSGIKCKGDPVPLALIILISGNVTDSELVMEPSRQD